MYSIFNDIRNWDQVKYVIYEYVIECMGQKYSRMDKVKFFKDCLPQILLGPF